MNQVQANGRLAAAVERELKTAIMRLPERQRLALTLRELRRLSHDQIARAIGIDAAAVAALLARARLRLRHELRGSGPGESCPDRDRALRAMARRQDGERLEPEEDGWLLDHLVDCEECDQAHAAMLEATACFPLR
jgi:hypothetical protein